MLCLTVFSASLAIMASRAFAAGEAAVPLAQTGNFSAIADGGAVPPPLYHMPMYSMPLQFSDLESRAPLPTTSTNIPDVGRASQPGGASLEMLRQSSSDYSHAAPTNDQQPRNSISPVIIDMPDDFPVYDIRRPEIKQNQAPIQRTKRFELGENIPITFSLEQAKLPPSADGTSAQTKQRLQEGRDQTGSPPGFHSASLGGPHSSQMHGRAEAANSSQSAGLSLRHSWLFSSTREKLFDAVEFMKSTGGDLQYPAPVVVNPPGYFGDKPLLQPAHSIGTPEILHRKPEQAYPPFVPAGETQLSIHGEGTHLVPDIHEQLSGSEPAVSGSMAAPQHNVYVHGNSLAPSPPIWDIPLPNADAPSTYTTNVPQGYIVEKPLLSIRGANLAFPLAARAYQFMVPRAELFIASSRYAEEYLDLVAALYCLFQKWPCNNVEEFAVQTRLHQRNAATSSSPHPEEALPS
uniref:Transmembrane protein n=1 Tax=Toxoplasma gondii COUG TaxID=1074873 RepID=A0A2G8XYT8_TOXGO|nr:hypothetical protein TGCOUG_286540 [Toxoplasma gondii COUG]